MRMLMKIDLPAAPYNRAADEGRLAAVWSTVFAECPPEASYYLNDGGRRCVHLIVDVASADQIAALSLPLYEAFEADVSFVPVMAFSDIEAALARR